MIDCDMDFENMDKVHHNKILLKVLWKFISQNGMPDYYND